MPEQQNPEHQLEYLKELRKKYEEALKDAEKTGDYAEAEKLKEELNERLTALEAQFPKPEHESPEYLDNPENRFEEKVLEVLKLYRKDGVRDNIINSNLTCLGNANAMALRGELSTPIDVESLAGVDNQDSWRIRESETHPFSFYGLLKSIGGLDSERAWLLREKILQDSSDANNINEWIFLSLTGLDSDRAWKVRELKIKGGDHASYRGALKSLAGIDTERAWKMRKKILSVNSEQFLSELVIGLTGIDTDEAWNYRILLNIEKKGDPSDIRFDKQKALAKSLAGIDSDQAWSYREKWKELKQFYFLAPSLAGIDTQRAWDMRGLISEEYSESRLSGEVAILSLNGDLTTAIGWRTARKNQKKQP